METLSDNRKPSLDRIGRADSLKPSFAKEQSVTEFVSVDAVFEDPGGAEGYERGGWTLGTTAARTGTTS